MPWLPIYLTSNDELKVRKESPLYLESTDLSQWEGASALLASHNYICAADAAALVPIGGVASERCKLKDLDG